MKFKEIFDKDVRAGCGGCTVGCVGGMILPEALSVKVLSGYWQNFADKNPDVMSKFNVNLPAREEWETQNKTRQVTYDLIRCIAATAIALNSDSQTAETLAWMASAVYLTSALYIIGREIVNRRNINNIPK